MDDVELGIIQQNDIVFFGEDFNQIKKEGHHLKH